MLQLLAPEQVVITSTEPDQYVEDDIEVITKCSAQGAIALRSRQGQISPDQYTSTHAPLQNIRVGLRDVATATALSIQHLSQATVEQALEIGQRLWRMQRDLKKKEYSTFLSILGWASAKARKFINLAKVFDGFESSQLTGVELMTLLSLCSKKYEELVGQLRETNNITQELVEQLIQQTRVPRAPKQDPINGWKQNRAGGGRRYEVILHDEEAGLLIEQQALSEGILPQRVIAEAVALRAQQKLVAVEANESVSTSVQENPVVEQTRSDEGDSASGAKPLALAQPPKGDRSSPPYSGERAISPPLTLPLAAVPEMERSLDEPELKVELQTATNLSEPVGESTTTTITQETQPSELIEAPQENQIRSLEPSFAPSIANCQATPPWQQLKIIRDLEGCVKTLDSQIEELNSKLVKPDLDRTVERELKNILASRQKLRNTKLSEIVAVGDENGIPVTSEELQSTGRLAIAEQLASNWLRQAQTWEEVMLVVGCNRTVLLNSVKNWALEQKQVLVRLLSQYLEREASALAQIDWIPKNLLQKALSTLSFKLRKIGGADNLMDEPEIEYICNCSFVSIEYPGTRSEQWMFRDSNHKLYPVFDREELEVHGFLTVTQEL